MDLLPDVSPAVCSILQRALDMELEDIYGVQLMLEAAGPEGIEDHLLWDLYTSLPARCRDALCVIVYQYYQSGMDANSLLVLGDTDAILKILATYGVPLRALEDLRNRLWIHLNPYGEWCISSPLWTYVLRWGVPICPNLNC